MLPFQNYLYKLFQRKTTSTIFIPEIDGLRFVAIILVVISHIQALFLFKTNYQNPFTMGESIFSYVLYTGKSGVVLFFAISGFVLMLPFARYYLLNGDEVKIKKYYLRRLTRLEPPYLLAMVFLFAMKILIQRKDFVELLPHLGATLLYLHTAIYHELSEITPITWSLEIEIQFYLLAPFLAHMFRLSKFPRRIFLTVLILAAPFIQHSFRLSHYSFLGTMQYFFVGFILVDLYLCGDWIRINENIVKPLGILLLLCLILVRPEGVWGSSIYVALMLVFYCLALDTEYWKSFFKNKFLTSIGGMCYSIYLLHFAITSFLGMKSFSFIVADSYMITILIQIMLLVPLILLISSGYYLLIEKPCMDSRWPQKLWFWILKRRPQPFTKTISRFE